MNVTTFGKLSNNLVVVVVTIVTMLEIRGFAPCSFLALTYSDRRQQTTPGHRSRRRRTSQWTNHTE